MNETLTGREFQNKYMLWALIALELFMSFSFLGYIHIDPISITFVYIPVLAAGCLMGPKESTLVGAIFGLASMWKASAFYVGAGDMIFSPIQSGRPLESILLSVGSRALFGLISGLLYQLARRGRHPLVNMLNNWAQEHGGETAGFFIILDIDHFKEINDQLGHPAGDRVLREAAEKLRSVFGGRGILGRLGGDEFVALIQGPMTREDMERQMERLKEEMNAIRLSKGTVTCSVGVIPVEGGAAIDELYRRADRLLYEAKQKGKDQFVLSGRKDIC